MVLLQGLPKGDKLELVLQKATELGVSAVWPVVTARSVARPRPEALGARHARWQRIVEEAARQSGRADVPEVAALRPLDEAVRALSAEREAPGARRGGAVGAAGPRGGRRRRWRSWSVPRAGSRARRWRRCARPGGVPVSLGPLVLRTETAGLAALAVLRHLDGLLG